MSRTLVRSYIHAYMPLRMKEKIVSFIKLSPAELVREEKHKPPITMKSFLRLA